MTLFIPCVSSKGEEDGGCVPAKAAAVRDRTHCENVWGSGDNEADAVYQVKPVCFLSWSLPEFIILKQTKYRTLFASAMLWKLLMVFQTRLEV